MKGKRILAVGCGQKCFGCGGSGVVRGRFPVCPACGGTGKVRIMRVPGAEK
ncbi:MAG: hypothetical protein K6T51_01395 [Rubrobacteraceae bacterium]|nr:hypothetical protein [Rubrobacteraceae bacterium]